MLWELLFSSTLMKNIVYEVKIPKKNPLREYRDFPGLEKIIDAVEQKAPEIRKKLNGRKIWMLNSTELGGGVAEMMPTVIYLMREQKIPISWLVMTPTEEKFSPTWKKSGYR